MHSLCAPVSGPPHPVISGWYEPGRGGDSLLQHGNGYKYMAVYGSEDDRNRIRKHSYGRLSPIKKGAKTQRLGRVAPDRG